MFTGRFFLVTVLVSSIVSFQKKKYPNQAIESFLFDPPTSIPVENISTLGSHIPKWLSRLPVPSTWKFQLALLVYSVQLHIFK